MPKFDGTGPNGQGPNAGRGFGGCGGGLARGFVGCCGRGMGNRRYISAKNELAALEEDEKILEDRLALVREEKTALQKLEK